MFNAPLSRIVGVIDLLFCPNSTRTVTSACGEVRQRRTAGLRPDGFTRMGVCASDNRYGESGGNTENVVPYV